MIEMPRESSERTATRCPFPRLYVSSRPPLGSCDDYIPAPFTRKTANKPETSFAHQSAHRALHAARCTPHAAHRTLHTAYRAPHAARCMLHAAYCAPHAAAGYRRSTILKTAACRLSPSAKTSISLAARNLLSRCRFFDVSDVAIMRIYSKSINGEPPTSANVNMVLI